VSTDSSIIQASHAAPETFGALYDRHARAVHRYAARRTSAEIADDIMAETFLVAFERRCSFDLAYDDARPWLLGIATTLLKKHARVEARAWKALVAANAANNANAASLIASDPVADSAERLDAASVVRRLARAIRRLREGDRDALLLYAWGDLDYVGVAAALGVPVGTVRSRLNRARRTLRAHAEAGKTRDEEVDYGRVDNAASSAQ